MPEVRKKRLLRPLFEAAASETQCAGAAGTRKGPKRSSDCSRGHD